MHDPIYTFRIIHNVIHVCVSIYIHTFSYNTMYVYLNTMRKWIDVSKPHYRASRSFCWVFHDWFRLRDRRLLDALFLFFVRSLQLLYFDGTVIGDAIRGRLGPLSITESGDRSCIVSRFLALAGSSISFFFFFSPFEATAHLSNNANRDSIWSDRGEF